MKSFFAWVQRWPLVFGSILTVLHHAFDALVDGMEKPKRSSSHFYRFLYRFMNRLAGNYKKLS